MSIIISTEEESLATRKAVEGTEAANRKLDALLEVYGIVQKDGESQREIRKLLQRCHQTL